MLSRRAILKSLSGALLGAFGFASYAFGIEPGWRLEIARYRVRPKGWPEGFKLKIVAISDIHASEPQMGLKRIEDVVRAANSQKPDIVLLLGDYGVGQMIYARPVAHADVAARLAELEAPLGKFGILGNHDYWGSSLKNWPYTRKKVNDTAEPYRRMLARAGVTLLENDVVRLTAGNQPFWLIGTGSLIALPLGASKFESFADLKGQLPKLTDDAPAILMAHEPDLFVEAPSRISLTLSGHTHGGQLRIFGFSPYVPSLYGNRFAYGHVVENDRNLIVCGGLGTSSVPIRFGVPPEFMVIDVG